MSHNSTTTCQNHNSNQNKKSHPSSVKQRLPKLSEFEAFKQAIAVECVEGSGMAESLFQACIHFHADLEIGAGGDLSTPIHDALGWQYSRFGQQVKDSLFAAFYMQETKEPWQIKLSKQRQRYENGKPKCKDGKPDLIKYESIKGQGSRAFLPAISVEQWVKVANKFNLEGFLPSWVKTAAAEGKTEFSHTGLVLTSTEFESCATKLKHMSKEQWWRTNPALKRESCSPSKIVKTPQTSCSQLKPIKCNPISLSELKSLTKDTKSSHTSTNGLILDHLSASAFPIETSSFWQWVELIPWLPIVITEGGKKGGALLTYGYIAIALTGINGGYRTTQNGIPLPAPELIPDLQRFANNGRKFVLAFDQDVKPETRSKVNAAIFKTAKLLTATGCDVAIARWDNFDGLAKGIDDFIVNRGIEAWHQAYNEAKSPIYWHIRDKYSRRLKHHKPTLTVNVPDLSTAIAPENFPERGIISIVSDMGTGKTKLLNTLLSSQPKVIKAGHRRSLERNAATVINLNFINDLDVVNGRFFNQKTQTFLSEFEAGRIGLCFESLLKTKVSDVQDGDLILDEADQGLRALLTSSTCKQDGKRPLLLKHFEALVKAAKRVILLSADLGDREINYICRLRGENPTMVLLNKYKRPRGNLRFLNCGNDTVAVAEIITKAKAGQKLIIPIDSLNRAKAIARLLTPIVGSEKIFQFNSQTSGSEQGLEFASNPDLFLQTYQPQIAIITPSGFTGLSMTSGYFDEVYGLFYGGSVVTDDCIQALERDRCPIPRTVWVAKTGKSFSSAGEQTNPIELKGNLKQRTDTTGQLLRNDLSPEKLNSIEHYPWTDNPHLDLYAQFESDRNFSMWHFRNCLQVRLEMSGYEIETVNIEADQEIKALLKEVAAEIKLEEAIDIANATNLTSSEAEVLEDKGNRDSLTPDEQLALEKYHLSQWYVLPLESITTDDVLFDNKGRTRKDLQRLENMLFSGLAKASDIKKIDQFTPSNNPATLWDLGHSEQQRKVLELIGFYEFLKYVIAGNKWTKDTLLVNMIATKCRQYSRDIKRVLGFRANDKMTDVAIVGILLMSLGLKTNRDRPSINRKRIYFYTLDLDHLAKVTEILNRRYERLVKSGVSLCPHLLFNDLINGIGNDLNEHEISPKAP